MSAESIIRDFVRRLEDAPLWPDSTISLFAAKERINQARARGEAASLDDLALFPCSCVVDGERCFGQIGPDITGRPMCWRCGPLDMVRALSLRTWRGLRPARSREDKP